MPQSWGDCLHFWVTVSVYRQFLFQAIFFCQAPVLFSHNDLQDAVQIMPGHCDRENAQVPLILAEGFLERRKLMLYDRHKFQEVWEHL